MEHHCTPMGPDEAERRFSAMLDEADLPHFTTFYDAEINELQLIWGERLSDPPRPQLQPDGAARRMGSGSIGAGRIVCECETDEPIHGTSPAARTGRSARRSVASGVQVHRGPPLHPGDLTTVNGIP